MRHFFEGGGQRTTPDNSCKTDGDRHVNAGIPYFKIDNTPTSLRMNANNIFTAYDWNVGSGGELVSAKRAAIAFNPAADF